MAPWSRDKTTSTHHQPESDPFKECRRFADEQINALIQGINAIPGLSSQASDSSQQRWSDEMHEVRRRLDQEFPSLFNQVLGSPERRQHIGGPVSEEAKQAARVLLLQARNANVGVNPRHILALYQDHGQGILPVSGAFPIRTTTSNTTWLGIDWFRHSPYSPIQLEQHDNCHQHGSKWRAAFEDLLCATLDKPQKAHEAWDASTSSLGSSPDNQNLYSHWAQPGIDWMLGLQCRGILPPQLPSLYNITPQETRKLDRVYGKIVSGVSRFWTPYGKAVDADFMQLARVVASPEVEDLVVRSHFQPETEMDMYENLWRMADKENGVQVDKGQDTSVQAQQRTVENGEGKQTVIGIMTTMETHTAPDGTVYTKRVLKKRFADGREETREEVSTSRADDIEDKSGAVENDKKTGSGWFWN